MSARFDPRPLTDPADRGAIAAHRRHLSATGRISGSPNVQTIAALVVVGVFGFSIVGSMGSMFVGFASVGGGVFGLLAFVPVLFIVVVAAVVAVVVVRSLRGQGERAYRLDRFAAANGMTWHPELKTPPLPGMIFHQGRSRVASDLVRGEHPRFVEFANYRYTTGSGKNSTTHRWGYIAIKLSTPLPHIVLDAVGNNGLFGSNLPASFDKDQLLSLEGDFDRYFRLYCPQGYERDALYLFTPDIMARLIDSAAELDVEIVDDWLFLYARRDFCTLDPRMWAWLFSVVGAMLDKLAQWERWRDDRLATAASLPAAAAPTPAGAAPAAQAAVGGAETLPFTPPTESLRPPAGVAQQGRRLQQRVPWGAIIVAGVFLVLWLGMQTGMFGLFGLLSR